MTVERTRHDLLFVCNKPGYETASALNPSGIEPWVFGNFLIGGLVGWGIDSATGADNRYEDGVFTILPKQTAELSNATR